MLKIIVPLLLLMFPSLGFAQASKVHSTLDDKLGNHTSNYNLGVFNFVEALVQVSNDFQIPMGIAWVNTPAARAKRPFAWKYATVQEIIQDIVGAQPGYEMQVLKGVVHVSAPKMILDRENFLKLKIESFETGPTYVEVASFKLHALVARRKYGQISIGATGDSKVELNLKNSSVEDILDAIALASNRKIWVVTYLDDPALTSEVPKGLRRTGSLWTNKPIPDEEQPTWALLRWGDHMPPVIASK